MIENMHTCVNSHSLVIAGMQNDTDVCMLAIIIELQLYAIWWDDKILYPNYGLVTPNRYIYYIIYRHANNNISCSSARVCTSCQSILLCLDNNYGTCNTWYVDGQGFANTGWQWYSLAIKYPRIQLQVCRFTI